MSETKKKRLRTFPDIEAAAFQHPWDAKATDALKSVPGLDQLVAKIMEYGLERIFYLQNTAANVRVTARQFSRLHRALGWGCKIIGVEEPELYVALDPTPNAFTYGHTRPFIVLTSGLIDMLDDEERFFVISHELGHIKAGHVLYTVIARNIAEIVAMIGQASFGLGTLLGQGLVIALHDWYRKAELTADRAGLLCVQDLDPCIRTFMKLAGGARQLYAEMDKQEFIKQIRAYEDADVSTLNKAYKALITAYRTHPFPILRAKELDAWHSSGYRSLAGPLGLLTA
ncbi:MAG: M48 family metallopeptidase [Acidobacteria bacterium]|jgi:Zn-dependent protease with chaperone function|nr:M48 family metallopeptidase [Acidobacteriota bacterium]